ncbi:MAG: ParB/RepB/Spo0J family partition protein [Pirellulales bacterium]|nr:ParB/RepB/Spo0J family partition protein [Pirellulales bacterium]
MIDVNLIRPNHFNPNQMSTQQFRECVAEIKHLGGLPHPIVVRPIKDDPDGKQYEIVDGEHRYGAALENGMTVVPVVILEIDEFEAMRQCHKRNRSGRDNKVKLGHMFQKMQKVKGVTRRKFAEMINVAESSIRVAEEYANAAAVRTACAPDTAEQDIARLRHPQVVQYRGLPSSIRDKWLDAGARLNAFEKQSKFTGDMLAGGFHEFGISQYLKEGEEFDASIRQLAPLVDYLYDHPEIPGLAAYAQIIAEIRVTAGVIRALPFGRQGEKLKVAIPLSEWRNALDSLVATSGTPQQELMGARAAVRMALEKAGVDLATVLGPVEAEAFTVVSKAPDFIKGAIKYLTLAQQVTLTQIHADCPADEQDLVLQAKQQTCNLLQREGRCSDNRLLEVYSLQLAQLRRPAPTATATDDDALMATLVSRVLASPRMRREKIGDRPAAEVLQERLDAHIPWPELRLFAAALSGEPTLPEAMRHWLNEVRQEVDMA